MRLRSSCAGSTSRTRRVGSRVTAAAATRCCNAASSSLFGSPLAIAKMPVALLLARNSTISRRAASSGATARSVITGISARSPASIPSKAGSLVRKSRTQVTVRAIASARASTSGSAVGRSVWTSSRSDAIRRSPSELSRERLRRASQQCVTAAAPPAPRARRAPTRAPRPLRHVPAGCESRVARAVDAA